MIVRELLTKWGLDVDFKTLERFDDQVGALRTKVNSVGQNLDAISQSARSFGLGLSAFVTLPIVGAGVALVKMASDAEEVESKFGTVFQSVSSDAEKTAVNLAKSYGLSRVAAKELLSDTGDLLSGFGFTGESALKLSNRVQQLAVDLASFTNFSGGAKGASEALTKALLGERESVKSLGIAILEEDVKKKVAQMRAEGITFATERQAKAEATLRIAIEQSKNAIGDYARTAKGFANRLRATQMWASDVAIAFGKLLLPAAQDLIDQAQKLLDWFDGLTDGSRKLILKILGVAAVVGPLIFLFGLLGGAIVNIARSFVLFGAILTFLKAATLQTMLFNAAALLLPILFVVLAAAIAAIIQDFVKWKQGADSVIGVLLEKFPIINSMFKSTGVIVKWLGGLFNTWILKPLNDIGTFIGGALFTIFDVLSSKASIFTETLSSVGKIAREIGQIIEKYLFPPLDSIGSFIGGKLFDLFGGNPLEAVANVSGGATPQAAAMAGTINRSAANKVDVKANINVAVPEGTPSEQRRAVAESARAAAAEVFNTEVRKLAGNFPEVE